MLGSQIQDHFIQRDTSFAVTIEHLLNSEKLLVY